MFFRLILFIILAYVVVNYIKGLFFGKAKSRSQYSERETVEEKEGSVTIQAKKSKEQKINKAEGDYVDFEDV